MRGGTASLWAVLALTGCRGPAVHAAGPPGIAADPVSLSFGSVSLGESRTATVHLRATGAAIKPVAAASGPFAPADLPPLPAGGSIDLPVRFQPTCTGPATGTLTLTCDGCSPAAVSLTGEGAGQALNVASILDLGPVPLGGTRTVSLPVANQGCQASELAVQFLGDSLSFSTSEVPPRLAGSSTAVVKVSFRADFAGASRAQLRVSVGGVSSQVELLAFGGGPSLHADPSNINLGSWAAGVGEPPWRTLLVTSPPSATPVKVASLTVVQGPFALRPDRTLPTDVVGRSLLVRVTLDTETPGNYQGLVRIHGVDPAQPDVDVPVQAIVTVPPPCQLGVTPSPLQFGLVPAQVLVTRELHLQNLGTQPCYTWGYTFYGAPSFYMPDLPVGPVEIAAGGEKVLHVDFGNVQGYLAEQAELAFHQAGAALEVDVEATGQVGDAVPTVTPGLLDFGDVPVGSRALGTFLIAKDPAGPVSLSEAGVVGDRHFFLPALPPLPFGLGAGFAEPIHVEFAPEAPGPAWAEVDVYVPPGTEPLRMSVTGNGADPCTDCTATLVACPGDVSVHVGEIVDRRATAVGPAGPASCDWTLTSSPPGSSAQPSPTSGCLTWLRPDHVGDFALRLSATAGASSATCDSVVHASLQGGIQVELTWSAPDDVDLHLFHQLAGSPMDAAAWGNVPYDVNAATGNSSPDWDKPGPTDDPRLVRFDSAGTGPEEVTVVAPAPHAYPLGARWVSGTHGNSALDVTARIFCDGVPVTTTSAHLTRPGEAVYLGDVSRTGSRCSFTTVGQTLFLGQ